MCLGGFCDVDLFIVLLCFVFLQQQLLSVLPIHLHSGVLRVSTSLTLTAMQVVYRVKKAGAYGGYEIVSEDATSDLTREELLNIRCGKKADRNCY